MTFPPCFANSFTPRPNSGSNANNRNMQTINAFRHQQQQSRLFSTSAFLGHSEQLVHMRFFEPRSATPDLLPKDTEECHRDRESVKNEDMEDNAARMLLELSQIVSKEISADSGCITRENTQANVHKNEECQSNSKDLRASDRDRDITNIDQSSPSRAIPKSIEINNRDWGVFQTADIRRNTSRNSLDIPHVVVASNSSPFSTLSSPRQPIHVSQNSSFEIVVPSTERNRYRTVSLAGDEMVPEHRELSPLLLPLASPLRSKDLTPSFSMHENQNTKRSPRHHLRVRQETLFLDQKRFEQEAIRRALVGGGPGAKILSKVLAASSAAVVITPVTEQPRPVLSFPSLANNTKVIGSSSSSSSNNNNDRVIRDASVNRKGPFPMELPPLLFNSNKKQQSTEVTAISGVPTRSYERPTKSVASVVAKSAASTRKASKKTQPVHGPRAKKKAAPKKQQRQRHTGKKFSWKAYPELEEFLIIKREEYLSYSAKNYTIEQRDYNNRLTSMLLEHAEASGYSTLFESCTFSAVRDRIRSYYKSYVQSFKRRKERQEEQERLKKLEMDYVKHNETKRFGETSCETTGHSQGIE